MCPLVGREKGSRRMASDFVCRIPLKPTDEPPKEDEVRRLLTNPKFRLADEFAVRYLESIGAAPTPANMAMVKKEIPSKRFKLKAAYKSRGGLEDIDFGRFAAILEEVNLDAIVAKSCVMDWLKQAQVYDVLAEGFVEHLLGKGSGAKGGGRGSRRRRCCWC